MQIGCQWKEPSREGQLKPNQNDQRIKQHDKKEEIMDCSIDCTLKVLTHTMVWFLKGYI